MNEIVAQILPYLRGMWANRWLGLLSAFCLSSVGWFSVLVLPDVYESHARFYLDTSGRLRDVVRQLGMEPDVTSRVYLVRQAMTSRPQLEKVARATDLDLTVNTELEKEQLLTGLAQKINISTARGREGSNLFTIRYEDRDPEVALSVVVEMLDSFVDDVLRQKDTDTERTRDFLIEQLEYYRGLLEKTEQELQAFRREHPFFVVGARGDYFTRMQAANDELEVLSSDREVILRKTQELRRQLKNVNPFISTEEAASSALSEASETSRRLADLRDQKRELLLVFTELHPRILAIEDQIATLEGQWELELINAASQADTDGVSSATNPSYIEIQSVLRGTNLELTAIDEKISQAQVKRDRLQQEIDRAPELEGLYIGLTRDYDNYQRLYTEVLDQSERERIGRVGEEADVISFNVIDPPRTSALPVSPNRQLLLGAISIVALVFGALIAIGKWLIKPTIHFESDLARLTQFPVLGAVGVNFESYRQSKSKLVLTFAISFLGLFALSLATIFLADPLSEIVQNSLEKISV